MYGRFKQFNVFGKNFSYGKDTVPCMNTTDIKYLLSIKARNNRELEGKRF
jgi:hypothetical protein